MDRRRLAVVFVVLLLLDYCHSYPDPPPHLRWLEGGSTGKDNQPRDQSQDQSRDYSQEETGDYSQDKSQGNEVDPNSFRDLGEVESTTGDVEDDLEQLRKETAVNSREKRGIGSLIFYGAAITFKMTSLGLTLGAAITKGCMYYPDICTNRDAIEKLDEEIKDYKKQYEVAYMANKKDYIYIRDCNLNNRYLQYYMNKTVNAVTTTEEIKKSIIDDFEKEFPLLHRMYVLAANGTKFEDYLDSVLGKLQYSLSDIDEILEINKKNQLIGIAIQMLIEVTLNRFMSIMEKAYHEVLDTEDIMKSSVWDMWMGENPPEAETPVQKTKLERLKAWKNRLPAKFKMAWKVIKVIVAKPKRFLQKIKGSIAKWRRIKSWEGFRGKLHHSLEKPIGKFNSVKGFLKNPKKTMKYTSENFHLGWSAKISLSLGVIGDIVSTALSAKQWKDVSEQMQEARKNYETFKTNLIDSLSGLRDEQHEMSIKLEETLDAFKGMLSNFTSLIKEVKNQNQFANVTGNVTGMPVDINDPLFNTDFNSIDTKNLKEKQDITVGYIKSVDEDLQKVVDELSARKTLYNYTNKAVDKSTPVKDCYDQLKTTYSFFSSKTIQAYGERLQQKDVVCAVSIMHMSLTQYDFYNLTVWRPNCDISQEVYLRQQEVAKRLRKFAIVDEEVMNKVPTEAESVTGLLADVKSIYSHKNDAALKAFGESLTAKDIVCAIARLFPEKTDYAFYPLSLFAPPCTQITDARFAEITKEAEAKKEIYDDIGSDLDTCERKGTTPKKKKVPTATLR